jgi:hypothetical protein
MKKSIAFLASMMVLCFSAAFAQNVKADFWQTQRQGLCLYHFLLPVEEADKLDIMASAKVDFFYFIPTLDQEKCGVDFLTGGKQGELDDGDVAKLRAFLEKADERNIKVILGFCSTPWDKSAKVWNRKDALLFWQELAGRLADEPACVGYDIVSLPVDLSSAQELNDYYSEVVRAIRGVDSSTTIVLESYRCSYSQLWNLRPVKSDTNILYAISFAIPVTSKAFGYEVDTRQEALQTLNIAQWASHNGINPRQVWVYGFPCTVPPSVTGFNYSGLTEGFRLYGWQYASRLPYHEKSSSQEQTPRQQVNVKKYKV